MLSLAAFAAAYSLYSGLSAVGPQTDVIQVVFLVLGNSLTYLALDAVSQGKRRQ